MNWKVRFKNPVFVVGTFIPGLFLLAQLVISFISANITDLGFTITEDMTQDALGIVNLVAFLVFGVTAPVDHTTKGFSDSLKAKTYKAPK